MYRGLYRYIDMNDNSLIQSRDTRPGASRFSTSELSAQKQSKMAGTKPELGPRGRSVQGFDTCNLWNRFGHLGSTGRGCIHRETALNK